MVEYQINKPFGGYSRTIKAVYYTQKGEYFNFYDSSDSVVLTVAARHVQTIEKKA